MRSYSWGRCVVFLILLLWTSSPALAAVDVWENIFPGEAVAVAVAHNGGNSAIYVAAGLPNPGVYRSDDDGAGWTQVLTGLTTDLKVDPTAYGTVYATTETGLYRSTDFGANWTLLMSEARMFVGLNPADPDTIYADISKSTDGGQTWTTMGTFTYPPTFRFDNMSHIQLSPANPDLVFLVLDKVLFESYDRGQTFLESNYVCANLDGVGVDPVDPRYFYWGCCGGGTGRCSPGGCGDIASPSGHVHGFAVDPAKHNVVYMASEYSFEKSFDFGATWAPYENSLPYRNRVFEGRILFDGPTGRIYLPTGTGLYRVETPSCKDVDGDQYSSETGCGMAVDCNDNDPFIHPGAPEDCTDGVDNDCDLLVDAADPDAVNCPPCTDDDLDLYSPDGGNCGPLDCNDADPLVNPAALENCSNAIDDDCDGLIDIADTDCQIIGPEICNDLFDNDQDGKTDCADKDCRDDPACSGVGEVCDDGVDNDGDGAVDCADKDCGKDPACSSVGEVCDDGVDNDGDGAVDCADRDCRKDAVCK